MAEHSKIEWTEKTWNPVAGCSKISPGCKGCYAIRDAVRLAENPSKKVRDVYQGLTVINGAGPNWTGLVREIPERLSQPLRWRKPSMIFVNSMSDLFHENISDNFLIHAFAVMGNSHIATGNDHTHTFQVLTKRAERLAEFTQRLRWQNCFGFLELERPYMINNLPYVADSDWRLLGQAKPGGTTQRAPGWMPPQIWLGVSVESAAYKSRIDLLRKVPAAVRFISIEPLLEDIGTLDLTGIHWVIVGGESGPEARPFDLQWARNIIAQCKAANVPCFVKQMGSRPFSIKDKIGFKGTQEHGIKLPDGFYRHLNSGKGGDPAEWPADIRVRDFPKCK